MNTRSEAFNSVKSTSNANASRYTLGGVDDFHLSAVFLHIRLHAVVQGGKR
ncbi:hypothetical protein D3C78_1912650 [compost metagenome]